MSYDPEQVEKANSLLKLIGIHLDLYVKNGRLRGRSSTYSFKPWDGEIQLKGNGDWLKAPDIRGGTMMKITAQIVLWLRGKPRQTNGWWGYISNVCLRGGHWPNEKILQFVRQHGVAGEDVCVLCGTNGTSGDWGTNHKTKINGPCCSYAVCLSKKVAK